jgi:hypothetical protein
MFWLLLRYEVIVKSSELRELPKKLLLLFVLDVTVFRRYLVSSLNLLSYSFYQLSFNCSINLRSYTSNPPRISLLYAN